MTTNAAVVFRALFLFYGLTEQLRENIEDFSCNSYAWNFFFFEKWLTKLSYEIKVKIKEVLTCSVVVLRYTVLKWNKILLLSVRCIWNISKHLVPASANSKQVAGRLVLHFVIHCVRTCFKAKNEITRSSGFVRT